MNEVYTTELIGLNSFQKVVTLVIVEILKNDTAYENFKQITGME